MKKKIFVRLIWKFGSDDEVLKIFPKCFHHRLQHLRRLIRADMRFMNEFQ